MRARSRRQGAWVGAAAGCILVLCVVTGCYLFFNQDPIAKIVVDVLSGNAPLVVTFDALGSSDPDGDIASYAWDFGDGATSTGATVQHVFVATTVTVTFTVTLTVTDDDGATATATQTIEVRVGADGATGTGLPIARFSVNRFIGRAPLDVTFDATDSTPGSGTIVAYNWDFGDTLQGTGSNPIHRFLPDETTVFKVTLFVWNNSNQVDTQQEEIVVIVPENDTGDDPPTAAVTATDPNMIFESKPGDRPTIPSLFEVEFDPRASYADAGHVIEYYGWEFGDGDILVETTDLQVTHIYALSSPSRTFTASLTVYDDQGESDTMFVNVTVSDLD